MDATVSLKDKTVSSVKWQVFNKVGQKVISVATFAILARILEPSAFGLFAMAFIAIDALQFFKSFGLDSALIQFKKSEEEFEKAKNTAFIIIQSTGILLFLICVACAPFVGSFFESEEVVPLIRALGFIFIFSCFSKVPSTILQKKMRFNSLAIIEMISSIANSLIAIALAILTKSVWSLVIAYLVKQVIVTVMTWAASGFRIKFQYDHQAAKELIHYGKFMVGLSVLWFLSGNLNHIVVGKVLGVTLLGYFALATNIGNFINTHFTSLLAGIMFPAYAKIQGDAETLKRAYFKTIKFISMISIPFSIFLFVLAEEFVLTLYGAKWVPVIPLIRLFGILQLLSPILWCSGPVFLGCGKPNYNFRLQALGLCIKAPLLIVLTLNHGLVGAVWASIMTTCVVMPFNLFLVKRLVLYRFADYSKQLLPTLICSLVMMIMMLLSKSAIESTAWLHSAPVILRLGTLLVIGVLTYVSAFYLIDREASNEVRAMILKKEVIA